MQQRPGRLVALQAQNTLQAHGADPVLLAGHPPHGTKPQGQRQAAVLKDRTGGNRNLVVTTGTAYKTVAFRPALRLATARAAKTVRPTKLKEILPAGRLGRKACLQLPQVSRIILHGQKHYRLGLRESSKYPSWTIKIPAHEKQVRVDRRRNRPVHSIPLPTAVGIESCNLLSAYRGVWCHVGASSRAGY